MKKALSLILAVILCFSAMIPAFAADEIPEGYTPVYTAEDLNNIRNNLSGSYILMNDIDLSVYENWEPIGTKETPFAGTLDGNSKIISNLKIISVTDEGYAGLFGYASRATIKDVAIYNANIKLFESSVSKITVGILGGHSSFLNVTDCVVSGNIWGEGIINLEAGGLIGRSQSSTVTLCSNYTNIELNLASSTMSVATGGITGVSKSIENKCANFGDISVKGININENASVKIGGIIGNSAEGVKVNNCYNLGKISSDFSTAKTYIGGLTGSSSVTSNSYNLGIINIAKPFSGFVGALSGNIENTGFSIGELPHIENSYYSANNLVPSYADTIHPDELSDDEYADYFSNVSQLSTEEMNQQESFAEFDFNTVWVMNENGYPVLQNQPTLYGKEKIELKKDETLVPKSFESWKSTDETVAKVNENGEIIALSAGTATVTIEHAYRFYTEYTITVTDSTAIPDPEPNSPWIIRTLLRMRNFIIFLVGSIYNFFF